jgi:hypothetical protein
LNQFTLRGNGSIMNNPTIPSPFTDLDLIDMALNALGASTGIVGKLKPHTDHGSPAIHLKIAGKTLHYKCEVKHTIDRFQTLADLKTRSLVDTMTLVVTPLLTNALAIRCRELGIQFIDTAGNAYLNDGAGILINISGHKLEHTHRMPAAPTMTPAALRMAFGFLAKPPLLNTSSRESAGAVGISIGAVAKGFETLKARGFIAAAPDATRRLRSPELLLSEWATAYAHRLRPKLTTYRFTSAEPDKVQALWSPEIKLSAWGGDIAADTITGHLKPSTTTIYMDMQAKPRCLADLVKQLRLRTDPHGPIEVLQPFWSMEMFSDSFPTVPLPLVYADLIGSHDPRNIEVAKQIFSKAVDHVHRSQG